MANRSYVIAAHRESWVEPGQTNGCEGRALELTWGDGHVSRFHYVWLRDHCPSLFDGDTRQRAVHHPNIPLDIAPRAALQLVGWPC